jgi:triosephosphate isomerase
VGAAERITKKNIGVGPQNMSWEERGPFTGEVSPLMIKELGCRYVELGHHERRLYFNENDEKVARKISLALAHGLQPLVCVGEAAEDKNASEKFLIGQMAAILKGVNTDTPEQIIIAYEPRWAIGQPEAASPDHARRNCDVLRGCLVQHFGNKGEEIRIIYGGSVQLTDTPAMLALENVNGLFIGRTALEAENFAKAVEMAHQQAKGN